MKCFPQGDPRANACMRCQVRCNSGDRCALRRIEVYIQTENKSAMSTSVPFWFGFGVGFGSRWLLQSTPFRQHSLCHADA